MQEICIISCLVHKHTVAPFIFPPKIIYWNYDVTYNLLELDKAAAQISSFPFILMIVLYID